MKFYTAEVFRALADLFFPRLCVVCTRSLVRGEKFLCSACLADMPLADPAYLADEQILMNFEEAFRPEALFSLFYYNKYADYRKLVYAVKYRNGKDLGVYLGNLLGERIVGHTDAEGIVPVPLHPKREKKRGYNQSYQIALGIAKALNIPVYDKAIVRVRNNESQTGKNVGERHKNVENIFSLQDACCVRGKHLLVVDDVITTGATISSCLKTLAAAGQVRFSLACLGRTS